ncbi:hypothetical protein DFQ27_008021 [Actinomortierella ambigua]|uniref:Uncharacterized protein n=1 Tax=Actinomortierella ambigua TaxID=1343610 RepID=A0A9P6PT95_9FUNG|nr:hypothetical protein DFQ27_008021 [Actinomortierella ambigua]
MLTGGIVKIEVSAQILTSIGRTMGVGYAAEMSYSQTVDSFIKLDLGGLKISNGPAPTSPFSPKPSNAAGAGAGAMAMSLVIAPAIKECHHHQLRRLSDDSEGTNVDLRYVLARVVVGSAPPVHVDGGKAYVQWLQRLIEETHREEHSM